ncbi:uncharacterized protein PITG_12907 [Phytophthora infestans T30-4]|uniref:Uncharacterized protein n=1 Tax=Phytophthora infestans (strain T30-4) TaxID=403677 RepID=D0NJU2_PHYIT|nr:uncharacterized protein PITG_12907 [Phytophthora infestans T30-4]EEY59779.1 conserved hypothetical protein [Phytophthora infestans T30-4]|eukprot:XP_002900464.1 conserved hypothetical protein [Phytophthora infestans T30-4]
MNGISDESENGGAAIGLATDRERIGMADGKEGKITTISRERRDDTAMTGESGMALTLTGKHHPSELTKHHPLPRRGDQHRHRATLIINLAVRICCFPTVRDYSREHKPDSDLYLELWSNDQKRLICEDEEVPFRCVEEIEEPAHTAAKRRKVETKAHSWRVYKNVAAEQQFSRAQTVDEAINMVLYAVEKFVVLMAKVDASRAVYLAQAEVLVQLVQSWELDAPQHRKWGRVLVAVVSDAPREERRLSHECGAVGHLPANCSDREHNFMLTVNESTIKQVLHYEDLAPRRDAARHHVVN